MCRKIFFLVSLIVATTSFGQLAPLNNTNDEKVKALNNYVYFVNESIHGMLIVHRLLENFNLDINKYVDLESFQINFYSNRDLPKDIFDDSENWFYDISPYEWYEKTLEGNSSLSAVEIEKLSIDASFIKKTITQINQKRFDIENLINTLDLKETDQLQQVYDELESCVDLFQSFYQGQKRLEKELNRINPNNSAPSHSAFIPLYKDTRNVLAAIREKDDLSYNVLLKKLRTSVSGFSFFTTGTNNASKKDLDFHVFNIQAQAAKALSSAENFGNNKVVPKEYEMYGKHYYYYNSDIINKYNRYGSGIVFEMNAVFDLLRAPVLRLTELPHYYKVIYPRKLEKVNAIATSASPVEDIPLNLEGRKLQQKEGGAIVVTDKIIEIEIYDHKIQDGDIVSLNFNGEWVLRRHKLTRIPHKFKLKLNNEGKNFLVLHAENMGQRPPNTMAISYFANGKKKRYVMNSDLNTSEVIEIISN